MSVRLRKWKSKEGKVQEAWWVDVKYQHPSGKVERVRKASPLNTRRGAEEYERQVRHALLSGSFGKEAQNEQDRIATFKEFVPRFITYSENNNKPSSVASKRQILSNHLLPAFGHLSLDSIGLAEIEEFKAVMRKKPADALLRKAAPTRAAVLKRKRSNPKFLSLKYINNVLAVLHKLLVLAQDQGIISHVPRIKVFKTRKPAFDFLTFEEAELLVTNAEAEWRPLIFVALKTGMRQGELIGLQWNDVDLQRGKLHVRRTIWRGTSCLPKGGRERIVDLPVSAVQVLKEHRHLRGAQVFCQEDGQMLTAGLMKAPLKRALARAGIRREEGLIGWHDLRHTYGSHLAMRGIPLKVIQELMGHATIEMTMRYAHLAPEARERAVQQLDRPIPQTYAAEASTPQGHTGGT
ncbi:tyrosine-type recombinase/integrase [Corallococcus exiguus]|uniref:Tyrosine-type recombinase/integrase n=1 Tax=Corallococcus exiguus TaxID=83462 RepID=A0A7X4YKB4_9BACT|nr:site-specific integrase [Corallococcus exiguus]NBC46249.1 tyrosine-type recombinase/integrase [Corallococcus exiguus]TNV61276.1 site-specific integrase [Corallococcus exiguus]